MRQPTQREYVLLGLLAVAAVVVLYLREEGIGLPGGSTAANDDQPIGVAPVVELARLSLDADPYDPKGRNLFKYGPPPRKAGPPPPPPPPPPKKQERPTPRPQKTIKPPSQPPKPRGPRPPKPDFEYLGFLGPKESKIAVFEKRDEPLILATTGDVVQGAFRVIEFKYEAVVMGFTDDRFKDQTTELGVKQ